MYSEGSSPRSPSDMKYKLVRTADCPDGLYRIRATRSFGEVDEGEFGGFVASVYNLSQDGECWIHDDACVRDAAIVQDASQLYQEAQVFDRAMVGGKSVVSDHAWVFGDAVVEDSTIKDGAWVCNRASARNARIEQGATVCGHARVQDCAVSGRAFVGGVVVFDHGLPTLPNGEICWRDLLEVTRIGRKWGVAGNSTIMGDTFLALHPELGSWFGESAQRSMLPERLDEQEQLDGERPFFARVELFRADPV